MHKETLELSPLHVVLDPEDPVAHKSPPAVDL